MSLPMAISNVNLFITNQEEFLFRGGSIARIPRQSRGDFENHFGWLIVVLICLV